MPEDYSTYVEHPRFGKCPRITGLDPDPDAPGVHLHWNVGYLTKERLSLMKELRGWWPSFPEDGTFIPGTAVEADTERQTPATMPVTHYYDLYKVCRDCARRFIFFAEQQKYWYEELQFPLEVQWAL